MTKAGAGRRWGGRDVGRLLGASVVAQALPFIVLPWLTRNVSPADIGRWLLFSTVASNMATVACLRYEYAIVLPRYEAVARRLLNGCLWLALAWAVGVAVLVLLAAGLTWLGWSLASYEVLGRAWLLLAPAVALAGTMQALSLWQNRRADFASIGRARVLTAASVAALQALVVAVNWPNDVALITAQVVGVGVGVLWLWRQVQRPLHLPDVRARREWRALARRYRQFPLVNTPHAFVNALQDTLVMALVLWLAGPAAAGLFGLTLRIAMAPATLIGGAWSEVLLGQVAGLWRDGADATPAVSRAVMSLTALGGGVALLLVVAGPELFAWVFGPSWRESGVWARWLAPYVLGRMIVGPLTVLPMIADRQQAAFMFSLCGNALYVLALGLGLVLELGGRGSLTVACAMVSVAMCGYFAVYGRWLWRLAQVPAVPGQGSAA